MRYPDLMLACAIFVAALAQPAGAQAPASPGIYVVTYFEVDPAAARKTEGLLRQFAAATRKEDGNGELTLLHEIGRTGRLQRRQLSVSFRFRCLRRFTGRTERPR